jgi:hypothetical protein
MVAALALAAAAVSIGGAAKDAGTGELGENVHVLDKSMRIADIRRYMMSFNKALSVQCRDCHDLRNFPSDDKPLKLRAREMLEMQKKINETWFAGSEVVTCWTCHGGARIPLAAPAKGPALADSTIDDEDLGSEP